MKAKNTQKVKSELIDYLQKQGFTDKQIETICKFYQEGAKAVIQDSKEALSKELTSMERYI